MSEAMPSNESLLLCKAGDLDNCLKAVKAALGGLYPGEIAALEASAEALFDEIRATQSQLEEVQETLRAIRSGEVDALVVQGTQGEQVFTLKGAEEQYRVMVEEMTEGAVTLALDGTIFYCNQRFVELLKTPMEQVVGALMQDFIPPGERPAFEELMAQSRTAVVHRELSLQAADGTRLPVHYSTRALRVDKLEAIAAVVTDLTQLAAANQALSESEDKFRYLFEHSTVGKSITSLDAVIHVNKAFCDMLGYSEEELRNHQWQAITYPDDIELTQRALDPLISGERESTRFIKRYLTKSGAVVWADVQTVLRRDAAGKPLYFMTNAIDITGRKRDEEALSRLNAELEERVLQRTAELAAANKELEAFAYSVSHDLRAPLRSIDGFSQALLEDYAGKIDAEGKDYLQRVRAATQRMGQLINDLLNLSRVTRGELVRTTVDLSALARNVATGLQQGEPDRKVEFAIQEGMTVKGDERLLGVVLENLLGNAWKYTSRHASARIEFGQADAAGKNAWCVRDDGAGFDMEYAGKLFAPFQRLHSTEEFPGNGIGLAIVHSIIQRHGGTVWGEGAVERGAAFYFSLD
ncbi:MAG: PAS domain S-box protein [Methylococcales bacterium]|nr:PAS domain S-box protein [Methylococcales bacterium]